MHAIPRLLTAAAALAALASAAFSQDFPAKVDAALEGPATVAPGDTVTVKLEVEVEPSWHVYGLAQTEMAVPPAFKPPKAGWPAGFTAGAPTESPAAEKATISGTSMLV